MTCSLIARLLVSAWLIYLAVVDVRKRTLPHWATTIPVVVIGLVALSVGVGGLLGVDALANVWRPYDALAVSLAFIAVLLSDTLAALAPALAAAGLAWGLGTAQGQIVVAVWLTTLALSRAGVFGAGDAKVAMILLALYPDPRLAGILLAACGLMGGFLLVRRAGSAAPLLVRGVIRDGLAGAFPSRTGEKGSVVVPLTPVLAAGALIYVWIVA